ncbi:MAG TPA: class I SAM-dependent methyltransferase [Candidatus Thermoplasmatota archaeon]|nr:class I SAM-dependent methyltransferase [Candidatus Thermoplasmatota archaeon]
MALDVPALDHRERARQVWSSGNYAAAALRILPVSAQVVRAAGVKAGDRVLDVACGTGNTTLTARMAGARVTGLDITPRLLEEAKASAALAGYDDIRWDEGDAQALPYTDGSFDVVLSTFGHIFAPDPGAAARELLRVTRPGGTIAFTGWTPEGATGRFLEALARHAPPGASASATPNLWGVPATVRNLLGPAVRQIHFEHGSVATPSLTFNHYWQGATQVSSPLVAHLNALKDPRDVAAFRASVEEAFAPFWRDNAFHSEYLLTVAVKA